MKLPKGEPKSSQFCPIAKAIGQQVGQTWVDFPDEVKASRLCKIWKVGNGPYDYDVALHPVLVDFINTFDMGGYPEFVQKQK